MADNFKYAQLQPFSLAGSGAIIGDVSVILKSMTDIDGNLVTMSSFGSIGFGTIDPGNGMLEEQICWTGLTQNANGTATLTGVSNVLFIAPYTKTSGLLKTHAGAVTFVVSNTSGFYDSLTAKTDDETISGTYTFTNPNYPRMDTATPFPTDQEQLATKAYADSLTFAGAPNASTSVRGLVQIATQAQVDAKTITGSSSSAVLVQPLNTQRSTLLSDYIVDSGSPNVIVITPSPAITAYQAGQTFSFKLLNTNTSPTVSINVNGLGAKNVVKLNGSTSPVASDMASGQIIMVEYDGTNFQMLNPVAIPPAGIKFGGTGADGALAITSGTTTIDLGGANYFEKNYTSISVTGGQLTFTNPSANGCAVVLKSQGAVILTSTSPSIVGDSLGASASNNGVGLTNKTGSGSLIGITFTQPGPTTESTYSGVAGRGAYVALGPYSRFGVFSGAGGCAGSINTGTAGAGGLGILIECAGALNYTGTISSKGQAGGNGSGSTSWSNACSGSGGGGNLDGTAGTPSTSVSSSTTFGAGGGGGGSVVILYNTLTANSGVTTVTAGAGGTGTSQAGGAGGAGYSYVGLNTLYN